MRVRWFSNTLLEGGWKRLLCYGSPSVFLYEQKELFKLYCFIDRNEFFRHKNAISTDMIILRSLRLTSFRTNVVAVTTWCKMVFWQFELSASEFRKQIHKLLTRKLRQIRLKKTLYIPLFNNELNNSNVMNYTILNKWWQLRNLNLGKRSSLVTLN